MKLSQFFFGAFLALLLGSTFAGATTISIQNNDAAGVGFNDTTAVSPVGGNTATTLGAQRLALFEYAASIWASAIDSSVPIVVASTFEALTCTSTSATLGSAGAITVWRNFANAPQSSTWYPVALANSLAGTDLDPTRADITARFNYLIDQGCLSGRTGFYYGFDGQASASQIDFLPVLLHEIGHGLGFTVGPTSGSSGIRARSSPSIFESYAYDNVAGKTWAQMTTDAERAASALRDAQVSWIGSQAVAAAQSYLTAGLDSGGRPLLYTPSTFVSGSSVSHWDRRAMPNLLMEPSLNAGLSGVDITSGFLADIGWRILSTSAPTITPVTGWYWNASEGGRGFSIETRSSSLFMASFLYASDGAPEWYVSSGTISNNSFSGTLDEYVNGQSLGGTYRAPSLLGSAGTIGLSFSSSTAGTLTLNGTSTSIERFPISGSTVTTAASGSPEAGWYWNASESGRGFFFEVQGSTLFMAGYLYDDDGRSFWAVSTGTMTTTQSYTGALTRCTGGQTAGGAYQVPTCLTDLGNVSIIFPTTTTATLTFPNGTQTSLVRFTNF